MPRIAREKSKSGIYHIMLRGTNRQEIFHDEEDCKRFLKTLDRYKKTSGTEIYGWCLMGNHVHLLIKEGKEDISITMKRVEVSYAWYYNRKYKTTGHLFQDRYKSENVESDRQLLATLRYIHHNPIKAGITKRAYEWKWSSCRLYYGKPGCTPSLLDSGFILSMFSENRETGISRFKEYNEMININEKFLDDVATIHFTDEEARNEIKNIITGYELTQIKCLPKAERNGITARIKKIDGITQRQIARILGISLSLVNRAE